MKENRRLLFCCGAAMLTAFSATNVNAAMDAANKVSGKKGNSKPNIIFILCDDMGYGDLACYG